MITQFDILKFWFEEISPSQWWLKEDSFDREIVSRFSDIHAQASRCELYDWRRSANGRLAEVIILDQFSRNMFRGCKRSFESDALALGLSQEAIAIGADRVLTPSRRAFLYMPFMHSESARIHKIAVRLFTQNDAKANLDAELKHKAIIDKFGRYPHRNKILGRQSTAEEIEFLTQPSSGF